MREDDLTAAIRNMQIAIENAQEACERAMEELQKLKVKNEIDPYMKVFDEMLSSFTMEKA